jgi:hypothetical protein
MRLSQQRFGLTQRVGGLQVLPRARTMIGALRGRRGLALASLLSGALLAAGAAASPVYVDVDSFALPTNATMMVYSPWAGALVVKNAASAVVAIKVANRQANTRLANWSFTDIALSPTGRYAFAADYGGEDVYGAPGQTSYVHRIDLASMTWDVRTAYIAGNIEAVSDTQVILKSSRQWVTFTNNAWGSGPALVTLNSPGGWPNGPAYSAGVYSGDFRYDAVRRRLLHGDSGITPQQITAFKIVGNEFVRQENSPFDSLYGHYGTYVLANDASAFYYGDLQVDALDVSHNLRVFPELIYAATADVAFGNGKYYDAHTGALLGTLPFNTTVYAVYPSGNDFWAYDPTTTTVHHFSVLPPPADYGDLVFSALTPCRLYDSRSYYGGAGTWAAGSTQPVSIGPNVSYAFQGGSGTDCGVLAGMATGRIAALLVSVSTTSQSAAGYLTFYPAGGANPFPMSVTQAYQTGSVQTSFAILSTDGAANAAVSGFTTAQTEVILDVVGYFAKPKTAALDCYSSPVATTSIGPAVPLLTPGTGDQAQVAGASCSSGYTLVDTACQADSPHVSLVANNGACAYRNNDSVSHNVSAVSRCCRAPGR